MCVGLHFIYVYVCVYGGSGPWPWWWWCKLHRLSAILHYALKMNRDSLKFCVPETWSSKKAHYTTNGHVNFRFILFLAVELFRFSYIYAVVLFWYVFQYKFIYLYTKYNERCVFLIELFVYFIPAHSPKFEKLPPIISKNNFNEAI